MTRTSLTLAALLIVLAGTVSCDTVPREAITSCQSLTVIPAETKTDILFVVDDSDSMSEEQQNLAANFDAFIHALDASPFKNDYQIGITTTSVDLEDRAPDGSPRVITTFQRGPNASKPYPAGALVALDATGAFLANGSRILKADSPTLIQDFQRNVAVGTFGSGKEQGLRAAQLALTDRVADGTNQGFLRPGARLAVVIVSDADDCSDPEHRVPLDTTENCSSDASKARLESVVDFVQTLRSPLAGERRDVVVAAITGVDPVTRTPAVTCAGVEDKADRYKAFVDIFGREGLVDDICNPSFRGTLESIANLLAPPESITLDPAPSDPRLLSVTIQRADGTQLSCALALPGDPASTTANAVFVAPEGDQPARITLQNTCRLQKGDRVEVKLLCAG